MAATQFHAGDVIVFAGRGWISRLIALGTCPLQLLLGRGDSHIGICADYCGRVLLFESTTLSDMACEITGKRMRGVKAVDPRRRIEGYKGKAWILRPAEDQRADLDRSPAAAATLSEYLVDRVGVPYEQFNTLVIAGSRYLKRSWLFRQDASRLFCSEMVALVLERIQWIGRSNASTYTPNSLARKLVYEGTYQPRSRIL